MRSVLILFFSVLIYAQETSAQDLKIGYVQVDRVIQNFPEHEDASKTYEKELQSWEAQVKQYEAELESMKEEFNQRAMLYSPEKKQEKEEEILEKRREAVQFYQDIFGPQGKAEKRKLELTNPIYEKIIRAIEILGERESYVMIFNSQGLLYAKEDLDLTDEVLTILKAGVALSPSSRTGGSVRSRR